LALSQDEVAFLVGSSSAARVCQDERFNRVPSLELALAYEAIYQKPASELFGGVFDKVAQEVAERAKTLEFKMKRQSFDAKVVRKREAVARLAERALLRQ
jgi:transcriptional regulator with XRE-family HTH domain